MTPLLGAAGYLGLAAVRVGGAWSTLLMVLSMVLTPLVVLAVPRRGWAGVGLCRARSRARLGAGVAVVVGAYLVTMVASVAAFGADAEANWLTWVPRLFGALTPGPAPVRAAAMVLCLAVLVPLIEEVCYRGVLFEAAARAAGPVGAVVVTAALWSLVHLGDYGLNPYHPGVIAGSLSSVFVMGLGLGVCRLLTGSALACAAAQATGNLVLCGWLFATYGWP